MPMWPSYVPIVQELLAFAVGRASSTQRNLEVGQPLGAPVSAGRPAMPRHRSRRPDGAASERCGFADEGDGPRGAFADTIDQRDLHGPVRPAGRAKPRAYAVNVDTVESDLAQLTPEQLRDEVWPDVPFGTRPVGDSRDEPAGGPDQSAAAACPRRLLVRGPWRCLFVETFLAWRFGHHATMSGNRANLDRTIARHRDRARGRVRSGASSTPGAGRPGSRCCWSSSPWSSWWRSICAKSRQASRAYRMLLAGIRLSLVAIVLVMIAQFALSLQRTGLPYVAVMVDDSLSMTIVDRYDEQAARADVRPADRGRPGPTKTDTQPAGTSPGRC